MPLITDCPKYRICSNNNIKWQRTICGHQLYIDEDGDISCEQKCSNPDIYIFIQNATFNCGSSKHEKNVKFDRIELLQQLSKQLSMIICSCVKINNEDSTYLLCSLLKNVQSKWK